MVEVEFDEKSKKVEGTFMRGRWCLLEVEARRFHLDRCFAFHFGRIVPAQSLFWYMTCVETT
jgi:hypothetical protein